jgi:hypothetical protein
MKEPGLHVLDASKDKMMVLGVFFFLLLSVFSLPAANTLTSSLISETPIPLKIKEDFQ